MLRLPYMLDNVYALAVDAWASVRVQKLRAGLTILGVAVGVAGIVILMGIGEGTKRLILAQAEQYGPDMLVVVPRQSVGAEGVKDVPVLSEADFKAIQSGVDDIKDVTPMVSRHAFVRYGHRQRLVPVVGAGNAWVTNQNTKIISGRLFHLSEDGARVCILGFTPSKKVVGMDPVGSSVFIDGISFRTVGLMERKGGGKEGDVNDVVLIPYRTARLTLQAGDALSGIILRASDRNKILNAQVAVHDTLKRRHDKNDFSIRTQEAFLSIAVRTGRTIRMFLLVVAAGTLFVGGVGVMNTMFVAVKDRTREIGIRRAVGASAGDVRNQFLSEALLICLIGCVFGVVVGIMGGYVICAAMYGTELPKSDIPSLVIRPFPIIVAVVAAAVTGLSAGLMPAKQAAGILPADALRYE